MPRKIKPSTETQVPIESGRITFSQYQTLRAVYYETGSIGRAAEAADVLHETASAYVKRPYPEFGGTVSIKDWAKKKREEDANAILTRNQHVRTQLMGTMQVTLNRMLAVMQKAVPKMKGTVRDDGSIEMDMDEVYRGIRNVNMGFDVLRKGEADMLGKTGNPSPGVVNMNVSVDGRQQTVNNFGVGFQGQRDVGPLSAVPAAPETLFERSLAVSRRNAAVMARAGSGDHAKILAAVRGAHEVREEMERSRPQPEPED